MFKEELDFKLGFYVYLACNGSFALLCEATSSVRLEANFYIKKDILTYFSQTYELLILS